MNGTQRQGGAGILLFILAAIAVPVVHIMYALYARGGTEAFAANIGREVAALGVDGTPLGTRLQEVMDGAYRAAYHGTGIARTLADEAAGMRDALSRTYRFIEAAVLSAQLVALRLALLALTTPFAMLAIGAGALDGWVGWSLRRAAGGRESAFIYHRAKRVMFGAPLLILFLYLASPWSVHPLVALLPLLVIMPIAARLSVAYFKKHI